jgi:hypothetical protein
MTPNENLFNNMIWVFTWSNMENPPILSKLDRILINADWNDSLPNSVASTLPRTTSDHFPLKIEVSTNIPRSQVFRYCNNWPLNPGFKDLVSSIWSSTPVKSDAIGTLVARVKNLRQKANTWKKSLQPDRSLLNNAKRALDLMDWVEERRSLSHLENIFKNLIKRKIASLIHIIVIAARQIEKVTWCVLGNEDSHFYTYRSGRAGPARIGPVSGSGHLNWATVQPD